MCNALKSRMIRPLLCGLPALLAVSLLYSVAASADCVLPSPPSHIPDGHSATEQEMATAMRTLQRYNNDVDEYAKCLDFERRRNAISNDVQSEHHNDALATLATVVERFNEQVRIYKARKS